MSGAELATIFGAFGTILYGFYRYAQTRERDFEKSRQSQTKAFEKTIDKLSKSINDLGKTNERIAQANERAADEAKERNGHLGELLLSNQEMLLAHNKDVEKIGENILEAVSNVKEQHVEHQHVEQSRVNEEIISKESKK